MLFVKETKGDDSMKLNTLLTIAAVVAGIFGLAFVLVSGPLLTLYGITLDKACPRGESPLVELYLEPGVFSDRSTEKLTLRVDFIHRVEFGEVSGHRVLIKRGPGNRGPTECGTTHEATSGMSS